MTADRPRSEFRSTGERIETVWADWGCGKERELDGAGIETRYLYDAAHRLIATHKVRSVNPVDDLGRYSVDDRVHWPFGRLLAHVRQDLDRHARPHSPRSATGLRGAGIPVGNPYECVRLQRKRATYPPLDTRHGPHPL
jgi:hypothetical protein